MAPAVEEANSDGEETERESISLAKYLFEVYSTSEVRFDDKNYFKRIGAIQSSAPFNQEIVPVAPVAVKEEKAPQQEEAPPPPPPPSQPTDKDLDFSGDDSPEPRPMVFREARLSAASKFAMETSATGDGAIPLTMELAGKFARCRGELAKAKSEIYEKPDKPRTGCEGYCIPGFCKGPTCKAPPNNYPKLTDTLNCTAIAMKSSLYEEMSRRITSHGFTFDHVIQTAVDHNWRLREKDMVELVKNFMPGMTFPLKSGCRAPDSESYKIFQTFFDLVISMRHNGYPKDGLQPVDLNPLHLPPDATLVGAGSFVVWCGVVASRNLAGFPYAGVISRALRGDADFSLKHVLATMEGKYVGKFFSPDELPAAETPLFRPVTPLLPDPLADGQVARDWPYGRSVWCAQEGALYVQLHGRDHLTLNSSKVGGDLRSAMVQMLYLLRLVQLRLAENKVFFDWDPHLGFLGAAPGNLGTAMTFVVRVKLPFLSGFPLLDAILTRLRLRRRREDEREEEEEEFGMKKEEELEKKISLEDWDDEEERMSRVKEISICNIDRLGVTEIESFIHFTSAVNHILAMEKTLSRDFTFRSDQMPRFVSLDFSSLPRNEPPPEPMSPPKTKTKKFGGKKKKSEESLKSGKSKTAEKSAKPAKAAASGGSVRSKKTAPQREVLSSDAPFVRKNKTAGGVALDEDEGIYLKYAGEESAEGFPFSSVIQVGVDNPLGAARFRTRNPVAGVGAVAGDEDCYRAFPDYFHRVIDLCHPFYRRDGLHPISFDLSSTEVANDLDMHYVSCIRISTSRNIRGFKLSPSISRQDRRLIERIVNHCLGYLEHKKVDFEVKGSYVQYSRLSRQQMHQNDDELGLDCCFYPPSSRAVLQATGVLRDWPDARGFWSNSERTVVCKINELDHMTFISVERSNKLRKVFQNHAIILDVFEERLRDIAGHHFSADHHLGFITTCPGDLGTAMIIRVKMKLQCVFKNQKLMQRFLRKHSLGQERDPFEADATTIYNLETLGFSESELTQCVYEGCTKLIALDKFLLELVERGNTTWITNEETLPLPSIAPLMHCDLSWYMPNTYDDLEGLEIETDEQMTLGAEEDEI